MTSRSLRSLFVALLGLGLALSSNSNASADVLTGDDFAPSSGSSLGLVNPLSSTGSQTVVGGETAKSGGLPGGTALKRPTKSKIPRNGKRCAKLGKTRTCTQYRKGKVVRVCTKKGRHKERCRKPRSTGSAKIRSTRAANINQGFYAGDAPMGKIWFAESGKAYRGHCSGTVVATNVVLTAAHCLYSHQRGAGYETLGSMLFSPLNGFAQNGGATDAVNSYQPYGSWELQSGWVPQCYLDTGSLACDMGLMIMKPNDRGQVGSVVGSYPVIANVQGVGVGTPVNNAGYPMEGWFDTYASGNGNAPYFCQNNLEANSGIPGGFSGNDTGAFLQTVSCPMTGGSSGGPVYIKLSDNRYYIWGVNNQADFRIKKLTYSDVVGFQPFGDTFLQLWNGVFGITSSSSSDAPSGGAVRLGDNPGRGVDLSVR